MLPAFKKSMIYGTTCQENDFPVFSDGAEQPIRIFQTPGDTVPKLHSFT